MQYLQVNQEFAVFIGGIPKACKREFIYNELKKTLLCQKARHAPRSHRHEGKQRPRFPSRKIFLGNGKTPQDETGENSKHPL